MSSSFDVIIAGLGAMGSAALYHRAARGRRVIGLDRFAPPHALDWSHLPGTLGSPFRAVVTSSLLTIPWEVLALGREHRGKAENAVVGQRHRDAARQAAVQAIGARGTEPAPVPSNRSLLLQPDILHVERPADAEVTLAPVAAVV